MSLKKPKRYLFSLFILLFLVFATAVGYLLLQESQDSRQQAFIDPPYESAIVEPQPDGNCPNGYIKLPPPRNLCSLPVTPASSGGVASPTPASVDPNSDLGKKGILNTAFSGTRPTTQSACSSGVWMNNFCYMPGDELSGGKVIIASGRYSYPYIEDKKTYESIGFGAATVKKVVGSTANLGENCGGIGMPLNGVCYAYGSTVDGFLVMPPRPDNCNNATGDYCHAHLKRIEVSYSDWQAAVTQYQKSGDLQVLERLYKNTYGVDFAAGGMYEESASNAELLKAQAILSALTSASVLKGQAAAKNEELAKKLAEQGELSKEDEATFNFNQKIIADTNLAQRPQILDQLSAGFTSQLTTGAAISKMYDSLVISGEAELDSLAKEQFKKIYGYDPAVKYGDLANILSAFGFSQNDLKEDREVFKKAVAQSQAELLKVDEEYRKFVGGISPSISSLKSAAIESGVITGDQVKNLSDADVLAMIISGYTGAPLSTTKLEAAQVIDLKNKIAQEQSLIERFGSGGTNSSVYELYTFYTGKELVGREKDDYSLTWIKSEVSKFNPDFALLAFQRDQNPIYLQSFYKNNLEVGLSPDERVPTNEKILLQNIYGDLGMQVYREVVLPNKLNKAVANYALDAGASFRYVCGELEITDCNVSPDNATTTVALMLEKMHGVDSSINIPELAISYSTEISTAAKENRTANNLAALGSMVAYNSAGNTREMKADFYDDYASSLEAAGVSNQVVSVFNPFQTYSFAKDYQDEISPIVFGSAYGNALMNDKIYNRQFQINEYQTKALAPSATENLDLTFNQGLGLTFYQVGTQFFGMTNPTQDIASNYATAARDNYSGPAGTYLSNLAMTGAKNIGLVDDYQTVSLGYYNDPSSSIQAAGAYISAIAVANKINVQNNAFNPYNAQATLASGAIDPLEYAREEAAKTKSALLYDRYVAGGSTNEEALHAFRSDAEIQRSAEALRYETIEKVVVPVTAAVILPTALASGVASAAIFGLASSEFSLYQGAGMKAQALELQRYDIETKRYAVVELARAEGASPQELLKIEQDIEAQAKVLNNQGNLMLASSAVAGLMGFGGWASGLANASQMAGVTSNLVSATAKTATVLTKMGQAGGIGLNSWNFGSSSIGAYQAFSAGETGEGWNNVLVAATSLTGIVGNVNNIRGLQTSGLHKLDFKADLIGAATGTSTDVIQIQAACGNESDAFDQRQCMNAWIGLALSAGMDVNQIANSQRLIKGDQQTARLTQLNGQLDVVDVQILALRAAGNMEPAKVKQLTLLEARHRQLATEITTLNPNAKINQPNSPAFYAESRQRVLDQLATDLLKAREEGKTATVDQLSAAYTAFNRSTGQVEALTKQIADIDQTIAREGIVLDQTEIDLLRADRKGMVDALGSAIKDLEVIDSMKTQHAAILRQAEENVAIAALQYMTRFDETAARYVADNAPAREAVDNYRQAEQAAGAMRLESDPARRLLSVTALEDNLISLQRLRGDQAIRQAGPNSPDKITDLDKIAAEINSLERLVEGAAPSQRSVWQRFVDSVNPFGRSARQAYYDSLELTFRVNALEEQRRSLTAGSDELKNLDLELAATKRRLLVVQQAVTRAANEPQGSIARYQEQRRQAAEIKRQVEELKALTKSIGTKNLELAGKIAENETELAKLRAAGKPDNDSEVVKLEAALVDLRKTAKSVLHGSEALIEADQSGTYTVFKVTQKGLDAGLNNDQLKLFNDELREFEIFQQRTIPGFKIYSDTGSFKDQDIFLLAELESFGLSLNGQRGHVFPALPGMGKTEVVIPFNAVLRMVLDSKATGKPQFVVFPEPKLMKPWTTDANYTRNESFISYVESRLGTQGSVLIVRSTDQNISAAEIAGAKIVVTTREVAFKLGSPQSEMEISLRAKWDRAHITGDEADLTFDPNLTYKTTTKQTPIKEKKEFSLYEAAQRKILGLDGDGRDVAGGLKSLTDLVDFVRTNKAVPPGIARTSDDKGGQFTDLSLEKSVIGEWLDTWGGRTKITDLDLEGDIVKARQAIDRYVTNNANPDARQLRAELATINNALTVLSRVPGEDYGLSNQQRLVNGQEETVNSIAPKTTNKDTGQSYGSVADQLIFNTLGAKILGLQGQINVGKLTVGEGGSDTNYALLLLKAKSFSLYTGTPETVARLFKMAYNIDLKSFSVSAIDDVIARFKASDSRVFTDYARQTVVRVGEFVGGLRRNPVYVNMAAGLKSNDVVLAELVKSVKEADDPAEILLRIHADGSLTEHRIEADGQLSAALRSYPTTDDLNARTAELDIETTRYLKFYDFGAHVGVDTYNRVDLSRAVGICNGCDETTFAQGINRLRVQIENGKAVSAPMDVIWLDAPDNLRADADRITIEDFAASLRQKQEINEALIEVAFKETLLRNTISDTYAELIDLAKNGKKGWFGIATYRGNADLAAELEASRQLFKETSEMNYSLDSVDLDAQAKLAKTAEQIRVAYEDLTRLVAGSGEPARALARRADGATGSNPIRVEFESDTGYQSLGANPSFRQVVDLINKSSLRLNETKVAFSDRRSSPELVAQELAAANQNRTDGQAGDGGAARPDPAGPAGPGPVAPVAPAAPVLPAAPAVRTGASNQNVAPAQNQAPAQAPVAPVRILSAAGLMQSARELWVGGEVDEEKLLADKKVEVELAKASLMTGYAAELERISQEITRISLQLEGDALEAAAKALNARTTEINAQMAEPVLAVDAERQVVAQFANEYRNPGLRDVLATIFTAQSERAGGVEVGLDERGIVVTSVGGILDRGVNYLIDRVESGFLALNNLNLTEEQKEQQFVTEHAAEIAAEEARLRAELVVEDLEDLRNAEDFLNDLVARRETAERDSSPDDVKIRNLDAYDVEIEAQVQLIENIRSRIAAKAQADVTKQAVEIVRVRVAAANTPAAEGETVVNQNLDPFTPVVFGPANFSWQDVRRLLQNSPSFIGGVITGYRDAFLAGYRERQNNTDETWLTRVTGNAGRWLRSNLIERLFAEPETMTTANSENQAASRQTDEIIEDLEENVSREESSQEIEERTRLEDLARNYAEVDEEITRLTVSISDLRSSLEEVERNNELVASLEEQLTGIQEKLSVENQSLASVEKERKALISHIDEVSNEIEKLGGRQSTTVFTKEQQAAAAQRTSDSLVARADLIIDRILRSFVGGSFNTNPGTARLKIITEIRGELANLAMARELNNGLSSLPEFTNDPEGVKAYSKDILATLTADWFISRHLATSRFDVVQQVDENTARNIVAVGDVHGDWNALVRLLSGQVTNESGDRVKKPLLDKNGNWIGGPTDHLILTGDLFDRAPSGVLSSQTAEKVMKLQKQAGNFPDGTPRVKVLVGNHDVNAIYAYWRMKNIMEKGAVRSKQDAAELASITGMKPGISPKDLLYLYDNPSVADWIMNLDAITVRDGVLYMHSDIRGYLDYGLTASAVNKEIKAIMQGKRGMDGLYNLMDVLTKRGQLNTDNVDELLATYKARTIVHGHSENKNTKDRRVVNIDGGLSEHYAKKAGKGQNRGRFFVQKIQGTSRVTVKVAAGLPSLQLGSIIPKPLSANLLAESENARLNLERLDQFRSQYESFSQQLSDLDDKVLMASAAKEELVKEESRISQVLAKRGDFSADEMKVELESLESELAEKRNILEKAESLLVAQQELTDFLRSLRKEGLRVNLLFVDEGMLKNTAVFGRRLLGLLVEAIKQEDFQEVAVIDRISSVISNSLPINSLAKRVKNVSSIAKKIQAVLKDAADNLALNQQRASLIVEINALLEELGNTDLVLSDDLEGMGVEELIELRDSINESRSEPLEEEPSKSKDPSTGSSLIVNDSEELAKAQTKNTQLLINSFKSLGTVAPSISTTQDYESQLSRFQDLLDSVLQLQELSGLAYITVEGSSAELETVQITRVQGGPANLSTFTDQALGAIATSIGWTKAALREAYNAEGAQGVVKLIDFSEVKEDAEELANQDEQEALEDQAKLLQVAKDNAVKDLLIDDQSELFLSIQAAKDEAEVEAIVTKRQALYQKLNDQLRELKLANYTTAKDEKSYKDQREYLEKTITQIEFLQSTTRHKFLKLNEDGQVPRDENENYSIALTGDYPTLAAFLDIAQRQASTDSANAKKVAEFLEKNISLIETLELGGIGALTLRQVADNSRKVANAIALLVSFDIENEQVDLLTRVVKLAELLKIDRAEIIATRKQLRDAINKYEELTGDNRFDKQGYDLGTTELKAKLAEVNDLIEKWQAENHLQEVEDQKKVAEFLLKIKPVLLTLGQKGTIGNLILSQVNDYLAQVSYAIKFFEDFSIQANHVKTWNVLGALATDLQVQREKLITLRNQLLELQSEKTRILPNYSVFDDSTNFSESELLTSIAKLQIEIPLLEQERLLNIAKNSAVNDLLIDEKSALFDLVQAANSTVEVKAIVEQRQDLYKELEAQLEKFNYKEKITIDNETYYQAQLRYLSDRTRQIESAYKLTGLKFFELNDQDLVPVDEEGRYLLVRTEDFSTFEEFIQLVREREVSIKANQDRIKNFLDQNISFIKKLEISGTVGSMNSTAIDTALTNLKRVIEFIEEFDIKIEQASLLKRINQLNKVLQASRKEVVSLREELRNVVGQYYELTDESLYESTNFDENSANLRAKIAEVREMIAKFNQRKTSSRNDDVTSVIPESKPGFDLREWSADRQHLIIDELQQALNQHITQHGDLEQELNQIIEGLEKSSSQIEELDVSNPTDYLNFLKGNEILERARQTRISIDGKTLPQIGFGAFRVVSDYTFEGKPAVIKVSVNYDKRSAQESAWSDLIVESTSSDIDPNLKAHMLRTFDHGFVERTDTEGRKYYIAYTVAEKLSVSYRNRLDELIENTQLNELSLAQDFEQQLGKSDFDFLRNWGQREDGTWVLLDLSHKNWEQEFNYQDELRSRIDREKKRLDWIQLNNPIINQLMLSKRMNLNNLFLTNDFISANGVPEIFMEEFEFLLENEYENVFNGSLSISELELLIEDEIIRESQVSVIDSRMSFSNLYDVSQMIGGENLKSYFVEFDDLNIHPYMQHKVVEVGSITNTPLQAEYWDPILAGFIDVWRDPNDRKLYVVNGHHRYDLARRLQESGINIPAIQVRLLDADAVKQLGFANLLGDDGEVSSDLARKIGGLLNLRDGRGTEQDTLRFVVEQQLTEQDITDLGLEITNNIKYALNVQNLHPRLFEIAWNITRFDSSKNSIDDIKLYTIIFLENIAVNIADQQVQSNYFDFILSKQGNQNFDYELSRIDPSRDLYRYLFEFDKYNFSLLIGNMINSGQREVSEFEDASSFEELMLIAKQIYKLSLAVAEGTTKNNSIYPNQLKSYSKDFLLSYENQYKPSRKNYSDTLLLGKNAQRLDLNQSMTLFYLLATRNEEFRKLILGLDLSRSGSTQEQQERLSPILEQIHELLKEDLENFNESWDGNPPSSSFNTSCSSCDLTVKAVSDFVAVSDQLWQEAQALFARSAAAQAANDQEQAQSLTDQAEQKKRAALAKLNDARNQIVNVHGMQNQAVLLYLDGLLYSKEALIRQNKADVDKAIDAVYEATALLEEMRNKKAMTLRTETWLGFGGKVVEQGLQDADIELITSFLVGNEDRGIEGLQSFAAFDRGSDGLFDRRVLLGQLKALESTVVGDQISPLRVWARSQAAKWRQRLLLTRLVVKEVKLAQDEATLSPTPSPSALPTPTLSPTVTPTAPPGPAPTPAGDDARFLWQMLGLVLGATLLGGFTVNQLPVFAAEEIVVTPPPAVIEKSEDFAPGFREELVIEEVIKSLPATGAAPVPPEPPAPPAPASGTQENPKQVVLSTLMDRDYPYAVYDRKGNKLIFSARDGWKPIDPSILPGYTDNRNANDYLKTINLFNVTGSTRYIRENENKTYCNIYAWDVSTALGVPLPHWIDKKEVMANQLYELLKTPLAQDEMGWKPVTAEEAQAYANRGIPTIATTPAYTNEAKEEKPGHIAFIIPEHDGKEGRIDDKGVFRPLSAQAGNVNFVGETTDIGFAGAISNKQEILYYVNETHYEFVEP